MANGTGGDESLEIVFWWLDGEGGASIEDELHSHPESRARRRRRLPWPGRRTRTPV